MNRSFFIGRLTGDPKQHGSGDKVLSTFSLAVDRSYKNEEGERDTDFPRFVAFGKLSDLTQLSLSKGTRVAIECHYQQRKVQGDNGSIVNHEFVVDSYTFVEKKRG